MLRCLQYIVSLGLAYHLQLEERHEAYKPAGKRLLELDGMTKATATREGAKKATSRRVLNQEMGSMALLKGAAGLRGKPPDTQTGLSSHLSQVGTVMQESMEH